MPRLAQIIPRHRPGIVAGRPWLVEISASVNARLGNEAKRSKEFFETRAAAEAACRDLRARAASFEDASREMTGEQRLEAWRCFGVAAEYGFSLSAAVEAMRATVERSRRSVVIPALVETLLADRRYVVRSEENPAGKAESYIQDLRNRLERFARDHAKIKASELTTEGLENWLDSLEVGPVTRNNFRRLLKLVCNYAIRRKWLIENPARNIEIAFVPAAEVEALTPEECAALLRHARTAELPVFAIGLFAGIRPAELLRMTWADIHFAEGGGGEIDAPNEDAEEGDVDVKGRNAKTAARRLVVIRPALAEWLAPYRAATGPIYPPGKNAWYVEHRRDRAAAGLTRWPADALRHTFCSMDLAYFRDLNGLVLRMGHTDPALVFSRYRRVVKRAAAARFWSLTPAVVRTQNP